MKKLFFLTFIVIAFMAGKANAQLSDPCVTLQLSTYGIYYAGINNQDTFTWYVTADGWLNYSLTDNGPGGSTSEYESNMYIAYGYGFGGTTHDVSIIHPGGGSFSGSVFIGTAEQWMTIEHDTGWIGGEDHDLCEAEYWLDEQVTFNTCDTLNFQRSNLQGKNISKQRSETGSSLTVFFRRKVAQDAKLPEIVYIGEAENPEVC